MLKKVLVMLIASAFTAGAFAQAQPAEPKGQTGSETHKAQPAKKSAKTKKATKKNGASKKGKAKSKDAEKSEAGK